VSNIRKKGKKKKHSYDKSKKNHTGNTSEVGGNTEKKEKKRKGPQKTRPTRNPTVTAQKLTYKGKQDRRPNARAEKTPPLGQGGKK